MGEKGKLGSNDRSGRLGLRVRGKAERARIGQSAKGRPALLSWDTAKGEDLLIVSEELYYVNSF